MAVIELEGDVEFAHDLVGPVIRNGDLAEAVIEAIEIDNPDQDVTVLDRDSYVRIHTRGNCRLTLASLVDCLGRSYQLAQLETDMPSFKGRLRTRTDEYTWFYSQEG